MMVRIDRRLNEAHAAGQHPSVGSLTDLREKLKSQKLTSAEVQDTRAALFHAVTEAQRYLKAFRMPEGMPVEDAMAYYEKRFGHVPTGFEVANKSLKGVRASSFTPSKVVKNCMGNAVAMYVLGKYLMGSDEKLGYLSVPGHGSATLSIAGVPHVVHAFGVQPVREFVSDLTEAAKNPAHRLHGMAKFGGIHEVIPLDAFMQSNVRFAQGRNARRLIRFGAEINASANHFDAGNMVEAVKHAENARRLLPLDPRAFVQLAQARFALGDIQSAERFALRATTLDPLHSLALEQLGRIYRRQRRFQEAVDALGRAYAVKPTNEVKNLKDEAFREWSWSAGLIAGTWVDLLHLVDRFKTNAIKKRAA